MNIAFAHNKVVDNKDGAKRGHEDVVGSEEAIPSLVHLCRLEKVSVGYLT